MNGPEHHHEEGMTASEPSYQKDAKHDIADGGESAVLKALGQLRILSVSQRIGQRVLRQQPTYREEDVDNVHENKNQVANACMVIAVA